MKKGKVIALALAAAITSMGAGYAAWQDSVTIQSQVNTGSLDVRFCDSRDLPPVSIDPNKNSYVTLDEPEIINDTNGGIAKILKINASNFYPSKDITTGKDNKDGYEVPALSISAGIINAGSIPAKINGVTIFGEGSMDIYNKIRVEKGVLCKVYNGKHYVWNYLCRTWKALNDDLTIGFEEIREYSTKDDMTLPEFQQFLNNSIGSDYVLGDKSTIYFSTIATVYNKLENAESIRIVPKLRLYIHESAGNDTQDKNCTVNIKFNWKQFNQ
jgi:hypothetical protein